MSESSTDPIRGAVVEIVDPKATDGDGYPLMPTRILVNGTDVGYVAKGSVRLTTGGGDITEVTLTLLPSRVVIRGNETEAAR